MDCHTRFLSLREPLAAGLYEEPRRGLFYRKALGLRRYYESCPVPAYHGEPLYPSGVLPTDCEIRPWYTMGFQMGRFPQTHPEEAACLQETFLRRYSFVPPEHTVAGEMYTHSMPDYEGILRLGLDAYVPRISRVEDDDLREGLCHLLAGVRCYWTRCTEALAAAGAEARLIAALRKVPFSPCETLYETVVGWNFLLYLDNCDNLGALVTGLAPYYRGENIEPLLRALFRNLDDNNGYSMQAGMRQDDACDALTIQCLRAARGLRRPMMELFVDEHTSPAIWAAALDCVRSGSGSPAFYNRTLYRSLLMRRFPALDPADLDRVCGGGCTELMISGRSNVGSLDAGINLQHILQECIREELCTAGDFDDFYQRYLSRIQSVTTHVMDCIRDAQRRRAVLNPLPMRTLLVDGCIDRGRDYNNGGARYLWSVVNFAGTVNAVDSLLVLRDLVFRERRYTPEALLSLLDAGDEAFLREARHHRHRFGIDDRDADSLARAFTHTVFHLLDQGETAFGWGFLSSSIQFQSYTSAGAGLGASPDGRHSGEALCDSLTAILGKDTQGPTALLRSVTAMDLPACLGTPVVNLTVNPAMSDAVLEALIRGYLRMDGMQLQLTCVSQALLEDAYAHPEAHENLVVRVGGYSEYFCRLTDELKRKVLERTIYAQL